MRDQQRDRLQNSRERGVEDQRRAEWVMGGPVWQEGWVKRTQQARNSKIRALANFLRSDASFSSSGSTVPGGLEVLVGVHMTWLDELTCMEYGLGSFSSEALSLTHQSLLVPRTGVADTRSEKRAVGHSPVPPRDLLSLLQPTPTSLVPGLCRCSGVKLLFVCTSSESKRP